MQVPTFDESLRTGHPLIDEQHEWLFKLAARVAEMIGTCELDDDGSVDGDSSDASCEPQVRDATTEAVYGLLDYATEHFSDEEALMLESRYPLAIVHASLHADLNRRLTPFVMDQVNKDEVVADKIVEFFIDWLTTHIMHDDREFTSWLAANPPE